MSGVHYRQVRRESYTQRKHHRCDCGADDCAICRPWIGGLVRCVACDEMRDCEETDFDGVCKDCREGADND